MAVVSDIRAYTDWAEQFGGRFLLDPNEINTWGERGFVDEQLQRDAGNVGDTNLSRLVGGWSYPFPVLINRMTVYHRNNNTGGWRMGLGDHQGFEGRQHQCAN